MDQFSCRTRIVSGAGAAIIGGLYWKRGGIWAAWASYIVGAFVGLGGLVLDQCWTLDNGGGVGVWMSRTFNLNFSAETLAKFPINGQWRTFIGMVSCSIVYILFSLFEHYVLKKPDFNLEKMLHRGKYDTAGEHVVHDKKVSWIASRLGITAEFTFGDKLLYALTIAWTFGWFVIFIWFTSQRFLFGGVSVAQWMSLWHIKIYITLILAFITTVWFLIGGLVDVTRLFKALSILKRNDSDDGSVVDGQNAGDSGN